MTVSGESFSTSTTLESIIGDSMGGKSIFIGGFGFFSEREKNRNMTYTPINGMDNFGISNQKAAPIRINRVIVLNRMTGANIFDSIVGRKFSESKFNHP